MSAKQSKQCSHCGEVFQRPKDYSHKQWDDKRFCSAYCGSKTTARHTDPFLRFEENYIPEANSGCWIWTGAIMSDGYGHLKLNGRLWRAHRLSHHLFKSPVQPRDNVLHACDNRWCVNPDHLDIGSQAINMRDMVRRGRSSRGTRNASSILSEKDIILIRNMRGTYTEIGKKFGVGRVTISKIINRKSWGHVP